MHKSMKKAALGLALVGSLGMGATAAQGHALAVAVDLLSNLQFLSGTSQFSLLTFTNSADTLASIGATQQSDSGTGPGLDLYSCVGTGCPANNTYPTTTPPATATFATADQNESGFPITGLGSPTSATVNAASYASTIDGSDPSGQSNNALSSGFTFALNQSTAVTINFNALAYLDAWTGPTDVFPTNAIASYSTCFVITDSTTGAVVVRWCPDGQAGGNIGITAETDPFSLNDQRSRNSPLNGNSTTGVQQGAFSGTTVVLTAGTPYQLSATQKTTADATEVLVPEPGTLALLGAGLFAVSALRRRKS